MDVYLGKIRPELTIKFLAVAQNHFSSPKLCLGVKGRKQSSMSYGQKVVFRRVGQHAVTCEVQPHVPLCRL